LGELHTLEGDLISMGYQIVAVSPDRPEKLRETLDARGLNYTILSDSKMEAAIAFRIAWTLGDEILTKYEEFGIDVEDASGESHHMLPVPAVFITGKDGSILFQYIDPNHQKRISADILLAAAKALISS
jgi:peroxiredoxin